MNSLNWAKVAYFFRSTSVLSFATSPFDPGYLDLLSLY